MPSSVGPTGSPLPRAVRQSNDLYARVLAFAERAGGDNDDRLARDFEALALDIARFQAEQSPAFARLLDFQGSRLDSVASIPSVPVDAFRLTRVAVHPPDLDQALFRTSGTTAAESGQHPVRELGTMRRLASILARRTLFSSLGRRAVVVALAAEPGSPPRSSLGYMMRCFMEDFDGRALTRSPEGVPFRAASEERWLASPAGVEVEGLARACRLARQRNEPLVVLATSFALVALLDALDGEVLPTPEQTVVMLTGGFKGRSRELDSAELHRGVARAFHTSETNLLGEYGMTELSSQLYESWSGPRGVYQAPPWLRVVAVEPQSLRELGPGEQGIARFVDLANVDSAVAIQTEDLVRVDGSRVELLGRAPGAPARGCSLPFEGLVKHSHASWGRP